MKELIVLVGAAGSGKSTYIEKNKTERDLILSSDSLREELFKNLVEGNKHNKEVFEELHKRLFDNINNKDIERIFYDATNLNRKKRIILFNEIKRRNQEVKVKIVFFILTLEELLERNKKREEYKRIPEDIIKKMFLNLEVMKVGTDCDTFEVINGEKDFEIKEDLEHDSIYHRETVKEHIEMCKENAKKEEKDRELLELIAEYHDLGKFFTKEFVTEETEKERYKFVIETYGKMARFFKHEKVSALIFLREMKKKNLLEDKDSLLVLEVIYQHNQAHNGFTEKYKKREKLTERELELLEKFERIDNISRRYDKEIFEKYKNFVEL